VPRVALDLEGQRKSFELGDEAGRLGLYNWLLRRCVEVPQERRDALLAAALEGLAVDRAEVLSDPDYSPLSPEQVRSLARGGLVEIASHSVHHYLLAKLPREAVRREVRDSRAALSELAGRPVTAFCMPGGSFDRGVLDEIFAAGYEVVLTSEAGTVSAEQRVLKRCGVFSMDSPDWFVDQVHGPVHELVEAAQRARSRLRRMWSRSNAG
jgi:peptidoglycan/xylan/chitin deacetylase (PgdA/CDA1 family)